MAAYRGQVYIQYLKSAGSPLLVVTAVVLFVSSQAMIVYADIWLAKWASLTEEEQADDDLVCVLSNFIVLPGDVVLVRLFMLSPIRISRWTAFIAGHFHSRQSFSTWAARPTLSARNSDADPPGSGVHRRGC